MADVLHTLGAVAAVAYALFLLVVAPVMGKRRFQRLVDAIASDPAARGRFYRRTVVRSWAITIGALTVMGLLTGRTPASIGLRGPTHGHSFAGPTLIGACVGLGLGAILVTLVARKPSGRDTLRKAMGPAAVVLPTTPSERRYFLLVSLTAGVTEELAFRGFLLSFFRWIAPGSSRLTLVLVSGLVFGLAHLYQGWRGMITTGIVGGLLADAALASGSLVLVMVIHTALDARWCLLPGFSDDPPRVLTRETDTRDEKSASERGG
ncbi:MAG: CPBP family intramembrane glutamic endopeptidase [Acidimicrobiales bacterium]